MKLREARQETHGGSMPQAAGEQASPGGLEVSPHQGGGRFAHAVERGLTAVYERLGGRYLPTWFVGAAILNVAAFGTYAVVLHAPHLLPGASRSVLMVEVYLVVLASGVAAVLRGWPTAMAVAKWWRRGRPAEGAEDVWIRLSTLAWRTTSTGVMVGIGTDIIGTLSMSGALREGAAGTASSLLQTTFMAMGAAAFGYFLVELVIRPVVLDAAGRLPANFRPPERGLPFGAKLFGALLGASWAATGIGLWVGNSDEPLADLLRPGLMVAGICLLFALTVTLLVVHALKTPMDNLIQMARRVGAGDFLARVSVTSDDELGELSASFNKMVEDLGRATGALSASRARIVAASDEARRKVERDLHDGAQQHLVLAQLKLGLLEKEVGDEGRASEVAGELRTEIERGIQELRELARGIYPVTLANEGLPGALNEMADRAALPVTTELNGAGRYTPDVETAIYFCCLEALQNASKHGGQGARAVVRLEPEPNVLRFEVSDDGAGFETNGSIARGGLQNMSDRLGAVGGELHVRSAPGRGTTVEGRVPLDLGEGPEA